MPVVIHDFEATAAPPEPGPEEGSPPARPRPRDTQRLLRQLATRAARLRAH
ncbi:MAG: hypothetical protein ACK41W_13910 [Cyanobacteriota bacterium]